MSAWCRAIPFTGSLPLAGTLVAVLTLIGCQTPRPTPPRTTYAVDVERLGARGQACRVRVEHARGPLPPATRPIVRITVTASAPSSLEALEQVILVAAARECAHGFTVQRASSAEGAEGYWDAVATAWARLENDEEGAVGSAPP